VRGTSVTEVEKDVYYVHLTGVFSCFLVTSDHGMESGNPDKRRDCCERSFELGSKVTDFSEQQNEKHDSQMTSTDAGIWIERNPLL
jgi:hypothetical protein